MGCRSRNLIHPSSLSSGPFFHALDIITSRAGMSEKMKRAWQDHMLYHPLFFLTALITLSSKKENYVFFGGIASRSSSFPVTRFCIDHPIIEITMAVIITIANRMVVVVLCGMINESIKKTGMSPIAIIFSCTCVTCIVDPFPPLSFDETVVGSPQSLIWVSECRHVSRRSARVDPPRIFCQNRQERRRNVPVFLGLLHTVGIGCRNPRERCDAAFLENREPWVHRVCWCREKDPLIWWPDTFFLN